MEFNQYADAALTSFLETTKFLKEISDAISDVGDDEVRKLLEEGANARLEHAEKIIEVKTKHKKLVQAMQEVKGESATVEDFERTWVQRRNAVERKPVDAKNAAEYKSFKRSIVSLFSKIGPKANDSDDDVVPMEVPGINVFSRYDPWTKALIRNPVRNKVCGHIYDREYVNGLIKDNMGIRCPVAGCANRVYIQPAHLVEDEAARQKILLQVMQDAQSDSDEESSEEEETKVEKEVETKEEVKP
ncbi:E3 SUMO-protein ligase NSE2-like isoform X1 [Drosophila takahashii]|uniref:E3 SUMO-protein ligase NSE2-like isoform X1 n=1 Tax=Drosophila takahashii TaxID=29030 RepID=UPI001CF873FE|nr:E3 SUMO-protein ligase NSE2-like isoform X1 [Drosophila takahashii]